VHDVKQLYDQLKSLDPSGENGAISRTALLDTVDSTGINLGALESLLTRTSEKVEGLNGLLAFYFTSPPARILNAIQQLTYGEASLHATPCKRCTIPYGRLRRQYPNPMLLRKRGYL
jgi:hypothetical protein